MTNEQYTANKMEIAELTKKIKDMGAGAPEKWDMLAGAAMVGVESAKKQIEELIGHPIRNMLDIYNVMTAAAALQSEAQILTNAHRLEVDEATHVRRAKDYAANNLKKLRTAKGLTQKELAQVSGVALTVLQKYENGSRRMLGASVEIALKIANALGVAVEDLVVSE